jgi:hypothetical protein
MNKLSEFIKENKDLCYAIAEKNTIRNDCTKPIIAQNDKWTKEKEWDKFYSKGAGVS